MSDYLAKASYDIRYPVEINLFYFLILKIILITVSFALSSFVKCNNYNNDIDNYKNNINNKNVNYHNDDIIIIIIKIRIVIMIIIRIVIRIKIITKATTMMMVTLILLK